MNYKIVTKRPWWWFIVGREWGTVAMTWGKNIYCQEDKLTTDVLVHELVHVRQNKGKWYISLWFLIRSTFDKDFYDNLELEAYHAQYEYLKKNENSRN